MHHPKKVSDFTSPRSLFVGASSEDGVTSRLRVRVRLEIRFNSMAIRLLNCHLAAAVTDKAI